MGFNSGFKGLMSIFGWQNERVLSYGVAAVHATVISV